MTLRRRGLEPILGVFEGCVVISPHPVPVVRFEFSATTLSYLTAELRHWEWTSLDSTDRVRIRAGTDTLILTGTHLLPLRNALDQLRLHLVREGPGRPTRLSTHAWVNKIVVERSKPIPPEPLPTSLHD